MALRLQERYKLPKQQRLDNLFGNPSIISATRSAAEATKRGEASVSRNGKGPLKRRFSLLQPGAWPHRSEAAMVQRLKRVRFSESCGEQCGRQSSRKSLVPFGFWEKECEGEARVEMRDRLAV